MRPRVFVVFREGVGWDVRCLLLCVFILRADIVGIVVVRLDLDLNVIVISVISVYWIGVRLNAGLWLLHHVNAN